MATNLQSAPDAEMIAIGTQCLDAMNANLADYPGVTQQMLDDGKVFRDEFTPEVALHVTKQAEARSQTQVKGAKRVPFESHIAMLRNLAKAGGASEAAMAALGLPAASGKAPANATQPAGSVDTSKRLRHTISWTDAASPDNKRRPRGTIGCEIFNKLEGPPPVDEKECTYLALDSTSPYLVEYDGTDAGKMAHYMLRWRMQDGSTSAWGETLSATITGKGLSGTLSINGSRERRDPIFTPTHRQTHAFCDKIVFFDTKFPLKYTDEGSMFISPFPLKQTI